MKELRIDHQVPLGTDSIISAALRFDRRPSACFDRAMFPCVSCERHLRETERSCPFCGAAQHNQPSPVSALAGFIIAAVTLVGAVSCAARPADGAETDATTTESGTTEPMTTTAPGTESSTTDGTEDSTEEAGITTNFVPDRDFVAYGAGCDPWAQDCPEGEKCVPYAANGEVWNANKCVPELGEGQTDEACEYDGIVEASDDCSDDHACWFVDDSEGLCTPFCTGTPDDPNCPEGRTCFIGFQGSVTMCVPSCDVLTQDCGPEQVCTWVTDDFGCLPADPAPAQIGDPCVDEDLPNCAPGDLCVAAESLPACADSHCCTSYCDLDMPSCPSPELACEPFFDQPPPGLETVGVCITPP